MGMAIRRFQFSMRILLIVLAGLCAIVAAFGVSFREYATATLMSGGRPQIVVEGKLVEFEGPMYNGATIRISHRRQNGDWSVDYNGGVRGGARGGIERKGLWSYPIRETIDLDLPPGDYKLELATFGGEPVTGHFVVPAD